MKIPYGEFLGGFAPGTLLRFEGVQLFCDNCGKESYKEQLVLAVVGDYEDDYGKYTLLQVTSGEKCEVCEKNLGEVSVYYSQMKAPASLFGVQSSS